MLRTTLARLRGLSKSGLTAAAAVAISLAAGTATPAWADVDSIRLDYAYYSPVSLVLKEQGWLEEEFAADGIEINWVLSLGRSEEHTSELQSLMRISYAVFCLKKKNKYHT